MSDRRLRHAESAAFRHAMRALSSGVAIIACGEGEARAGCTVTSLASLSLAPPTLFVCLARSSSTLAALREAGAFSISLLGARHEALAHRFSGHAHGVRRFDGAEWITLSTGAPRSRRRDRGLRLPDRRGHRTPFACNHPRRGGEPARGGGRTSARPPARGLLAADVRRSGTDRAWRRVHPHRVEILGHALVACVRPTRGATITRGWNRDNFGPEQRDYAGLRDYGDRDYGDYGITVTAYLIPQPQPSASGRAAWDADAGRARRPGGQGTERAPNGLGRAQRR